MISDKAKSVLHQLTLNEKKNINGMNASGKSQFLTESFGNESERFGISFGLFPLWVKEVLDELTEK